MFVKSFGTNLRAAATGSESAIGIFRKLGFSQEDIQKGLKNSDYALVKAAAGFGELDGGLAKGAIAAKLFGKGYAKIFPLLRDGAKSFKESIAEAKQYGAVLHGNAINSSMEFAEAQRKVELAMLGLQITFTEKVLPSLIRVVNWFAKMLNEFRQGKGPINDVVEAVTPFAEALFNVGKFIVADDTLLKALVFSLIAFKVAATAASIAMTLFDVALWANPIGLVVLGVIALGVALFVAYHKVKWFHDAVDAVFGFIKDHWRVLIIPFAPIVGSLVIIAANLEHLKDAFNWVKEAGENVLDWFKSSSLGRVLSAPFRATLWVVNKLIDGFEKAKSIVESLNGQGATPTHYGPLNPEPQPGDPVGKSPLQNRGPKNPFDNPGITKRPRANKIEFKSGFGGGGGGRPIIVHSILNGKVIATAVAEAADDAAAVA